MTSAWDDDVAGMGFDPGPAGDPAILDRQVIDAVARRIHQKMDDYEAYNFSTKQSISLNVFFDLAQEFPHVEHLYAVCLLIPKMFFDIECNLYVLDSKSGAIRRCAYSCADADAVMAAWRQLSVSPKMPEVVARSGPGSMPMPAAFHR